MAYSLHDPNKPSIVTSLSTMLFSEGYTDNIFIQLIQVTIIIYIIMGW